MFVRASLARPLLSASCLARWKDSLEATGSRCRLALFASGPPKKFREIKENPLFAVPLELYEQEPEQEPSDSDESYDLSPEENEQTSSSPSKAKTRPFKHKVAPRLTKLTLKDIPPRVQHLLWHKSRKLPVQIVVGNKGINKGLLMSVHNHFRRNDVVKVSVCRRWEDNAAMVAQELEERSGAIVIHQGGRRMILFRGYEGGYNVPAKTPRLIKEWWDDFRQEESNKEQQPQEQEVESA